MRAVRSENMFRRSYFNCCPHKILYQLIAIPTVNKIQVNFTDRGEQQEKKKKQSPQKLVFIHLKNWNQIYTHQSHIYVWIVLRWLICENTSSLLTLQGWVPHRSGCQAQKTETCIVLIFFVKVNQDEQERQKGPQVHRSTSHCQKQLCLPGWIQEPSSLSLFLLKCYSISSQMKLHLRSACAFLVPAVPIGRLFLLLFVLMASNLRLISRLSLVTYGFK